MSVLRLLGNVVWLIFIGLPVAITTAVGGILTCVTIIGIPFGLQAFKIAVYVLWPFGSEVVQVRDTAAGCVGNVLWFVLGGLWSALLALVLGIVFCVLIVTIPIGIVALRMVPLLAFPFGKAVVPAGSRGLSAQA